MHGVEPMVPASPTPLTPSGFKGDGVSMCEVSTTGTSVAVGDFESEIDEERAAREREDTKRLLYVALTRARDRLRELLRTLPCLL